MFKKEKMDEAAIKIKGAENYESIKKQESKSSKKSFGDSIWNFVCAPFIMLGKLFQKIWSWICSINFIGLLNLTLLVAIIVLFLMLIMDISKCKNPLVAPIINKPKNDIIILPKAPISAPEKEIKNTEKASTNTTDNLDKKITEIALSLPLKKELVQTVKSDIIKSTVQTMYGDTIIDGMLPGEKLSNGTQIMGNVYLQNMRRYSLPCNINIEGDLFIRNVGMLKFCGTFTITGNIYVSPNSSFGPIPGDARIGGQVIL